MRDDCKQDRWGSHWLCVWPPSRSMAIMNQRGGNSLSFSSSNTLVMLLMLPSSLFQVSVSGTNGAGRRENTHSSPLVKLSIILDSGHLIGRKSTFLPCYLNFHFPVLYASSASFPRVSVDQAFASCFPRTQPLGFPVEVQPLWAYLCSWSRIEFSPHRFAFHVPLHLAS